MEQKYIDELTKVKPIEDYFDKEYGEKTIEIEKLGLTVDDIPLVKKYSYDEYCDHSFISIVGYVYNPVFLSWCKSYKEEMEEFKRLIQGKPADVKQLRVEYKQLKNKVRYRG